ncbi:phage holin family protein [Telmatospirillum sp. J64-1]|uniref:phage holin family protein n=1 Tax=Telmatospirillum sp. J64-1 TaxID=2502183 RepID=UPI00115D0BCE|nr:phage holin family protein [Telmatospirillum sp. J64-1]
MPNGVRDERSLGALFSDLTRETTTLFRKEVDLAKAEMSETLSRASSGLIGLVAGGLIAFIGIQVLVAAAVLGLALFMPWWVAALVVGLAVLAIGGIVLAVGLSNLRARKLVPKRTITTMRDTTSWAKQQLR